MTVPQAMRVIRKAIQYDEGDALEAFLVIEKALKNGGPT